MGATARDIAWTCRGLNMAAPRIENSAGPSPAPFSAC